MDGNWFEAALAGDLDRVLEHLRGGADVDAKGRGDETALHTATRARHLDVIRALLDHGADANARARNAWTPVTVAVAPYRSRFPAGPDPRVLELLKAVGGRLGLREAVVMGDVELARRLCDDDPALDISGDARFSFTETYLMLATERRDRGMVRFLLDRGADVERTDDLGATALMRAAAAGDPEVFRLILGRGADIDHDD